MADLRWTPGMLLSPGTRCTFWHPAGTVDVPGKGEFRERFAPGAFDRVVGSIVPFTYEGRTLAQVRIVAAEVDADGSGVSLTYEVLGDG